MNGKEPIPEENDSSLLKDLGICGGDLVYILSASTIPINSTPLPSTKISSIVSNSNSNLSSTSTPNSNSIHQPSNSVSNVSTTIPSNSNYISTTPLNSNTISNITSTSTSPSMVINAKQPPSILSETMTSLFESYTAKTPHEAMCAIIHSIMLNSHFQNVIFFFSF